MVEFKTPDRWLLTEPFSLQSRDILYLSTATATRWNRVINQLSTTAQTIWYTCYCEKCLNLRNRDVINTIGTKQISVSEGDEIDLSALINQLMANIWLIVFVTATTLGIGVLYVYKQVPQYQSDVLLQVDSSRAGFGQGGFVGQLAMGGSRSGSSVQTQMALIQSRFILDQVVQSMGLNIDVSPKNGTLLERLFEKNISKNTIEIKSFEVPQAKLNMMFQLQVDRPGHILLLDSEGKKILQGQIGTNNKAKNGNIRLTINAIHSPVGSIFSLVKRSNAIVVRSLIGQLKLEESGDKGYQGTGIISATLTGRDPKQVIRILNAIAQAAQAQDAKRQYKETSQTLMFLYRQLPITKGQLETAEYNLNSYRAKSGKIDIKLQTQFLINQLSDFDKKIRDLQIQKIDMQQRFTRQHPSIIAMDRQIKGMDAQRHKLERLLKTMPASDQIAMNLQRDVTVKKTLYLVLLNKIQELQVEKAGMVSGIRILSSAKMPDSPLPGKRVAIYFGSLLFGLMLSGAIIFGRRLLSQRVEDPHWSERQFNLPNLAIIPFCAEQGVESRMLDSTKQVTLMAFSNPRSLAMESLRSLRTNLQVSMLGVSNNIVSIMGVSPSVGKSFISANLAYLIASAGKRVLVIDADLRRGTLHKYFNMPSSPGLTDVLINTASIETVLRVTENENLMCLPCGTYSSDPSELLMSEHFKLLMQTLSQQFDVIVIDTAPVLLVTDAVIVGRVSGTNYIVFGAGVHQPIEIEMALKRFTDSGVQLHGSLFNFNRTPSRQTSYGQYYYNNNSYYYDEKLKSN